ncbi:MAG: hypothetical protein WA865_09460 [Spirulinaceae cyanobacterium]
MQNTKEETKGVQQFLEVKPQNLYSLTLKQNKGKLSERIANYYELKEKFQDSAWSRFFTDD